MLLLLLELPLSDTFFCPGFEIYALWEFAVVIQLLPLHCIVVIFEALQVDDHCVLQIFYVRPTLSFNFAIVLVAEIFVVAIEQVRLDEQVKCLGKLLFVLYVKRKCEEGLFTVANIGVFFLS